MIFPIRFVAKSEFGSILAQIWILVVQTGPWLQLALILLLPMLQPGVLPKLDALTLRFSQPLIIWVVTWPWLILLRIVESVSLSKPRCLTPTQVYTVVEFSTLSPLLILSTPKTIPILSSLKTIFHLIVARAYPMTRISLKFLPLLLWKLAILSSKSLWCSIVLPWAWVLIYFLHLLISKTKTTIFLISLVVLTRPWNVTDWFTQPLLISCTHAHLSTLFKFNLVSIIFSRPWSLLLLFLPWNVTKTVSLYLILISIHIITSYLCLRLILTQSTLVSKLRWCLWEISLNFIGSRTHVWTFAIHF